MAAVNYMIKYASNPEIIIPYIDMVNCVGCLGIPMVWFRFGESVCKSIEILGSFLGDYLSLGFCIYVYRYG